MKMKVLFLISLILNTGMTFALSPINDNGPEEYNLSLKSKILLSEYDIDDLKYDNYECFSDSYDMACYSLNNSVIIDLIDQKPISYRLYFSNSDWGVRNDILNSIDIFLKHTRIIYDKNKLKDFIGLIKIPAKNDIKAYQLSDDLIISYYSPDHHHRYKDRNNLILIYKLNK